MTEPDTLPTIVGLLIVGIAFLFAAWKAKGIKYGISPASVGPIYPLSRVGRICLFLIGVVLLVDAVLDLLKRYY